MDWNQWLLEYLAARFEADLEDASQEVDFDAT
jgi:hypothetical protein